MALGRYEYINIGLGRTNTLFAIRCIYVAYIKCIVYIRIYGGVSYLVTRLLGLFTVSNLCIVNTDDDS